MNLLIYVSLAVICVLSFIYLFFISKRKNEAKLQEIELEEKLNVLVSKLEESFESITSKSLSQNAEFVQKISTSGVDLVLKPLVQQLKEYESKINKIAQNESNERTSLKEMLKNLSEVNQNFSKEAEKFVISVRGNIHAAGRWGEDTLQNILDASGLNEGTDYEKQKTFNCVGGNSIRPDFVIRAPMNRGVIIDSKLPINAFMKFIEATNDDESKSASGELVKNINNHITDLCKKNYQTVEDFNSFDYVIMFISSDAALSHALSIDKNLIRNALSKNILIVGPTTMMATLKTIEFLWREQKQLENYKELGITGKRLYEKCSHFTERLKDTQKHFQKANESLETAFNHLNRGNSSIISEAQKLKELGISSEKVIKNDKKQ